MSILLGGAVIFDRLADAAKPESGNKREGQKDK
jgi:hypothetical protein